MRFVNFFSGGFITATIVNQPERKLAKRTSVQCVDLPLGADLIIKCNMLFLVQSILSMVQIWIAVCRTFLLLVEESLLYVRMYSVYELLVRFHFCLG